MLSLAALIQTTRNTMIAYISGCHLSIASYAYIIEGSAIS